MADSTGAEKKELTREQLLVYIKKLKVTWIGMEWNGFEMHRPIHLWLCIMHVMQCAQPLLTPTPWNRSTNDPSIHNTNRSG